MVKTRRRWENGESANIQYYVANAFGRNQLKKQNDAIYKRHKACREISSSIPGIFERFFQKLDTFVCVQSISIYSDTQIEIFFIQNRQGALRLHFSRIIRYTDLFFAEVAPTL